MDHMLNLLGINSSTPIKFILGALLLGLGVTRHAVVLIAIGALLLAFALATMGRAKNA
jgi:hypothetical protein